MFHTNSFSATRNSITACLYHISLTPLWSGAVRKLYKFVSSKISHSYHCHWPKKKVHYLLGHPCICFLCIVNHHWFQFGVITLPGCIQKAGHAYSRILSVAWYFNEITNESTHESKLTLLQHAFLSLLRTWCAWQFGSEGLGLAEHSSVWCFILCKFKMSIIFLSPNFLGVGGET
jgi:hypothetical protein